MYIYISIEMHIVYRKKERMGICLKYFVVNSVFRYGAQLQNNAYVVGLNLFHRDALSVCTWILSVGPIVIFLG